jgi:hypothetical protein
MFKKVRSSVRADKGIYELIPAELASHRLSYKSQRVGLKVGFMW